MLNIDKMKISHYTTVQWSTKFMIVLTMRLKQKARKVYTMQLKIWSVVETYWQPNSVPMIR